MEKTKKISIISILSVVVLMIGLLTSFNKVAGVTGVLSGTTGIQTAGGDKENDPCSNSGSSDMDSAMEESCGGGGGGGSLPPPTLPQQPSQPVQAATSTVMVIVTQAETTGQITAQEKSCIIPFGKDSCLIKFDWSTQNPTGTSSVIRAPYNLGSSKGITFANSNSGQGVNLSVYYGNFDFWLVHRGKDLSVANGVSANCQYGSTWVPAENKCIENLSVTKFSTSNCEIPIGASSCNSNISWDVKGGYGDFSVTTPVSKTVGTGRLGNTNYLVEYPSRVFYLNNNGNEIGTSISYADCKAGSSWDLNSKKCIADIIPPACPFGTTLNIGNNKCECDNGAKNPPNCTVSPVCPFGTTLNIGNNKCECDNGAKNPPTCSEIGSLSNFEVTDCLIKVNENSCLVQLSWLSTLAGSFAITTPENITVSNSLSGNNISHKVEYDHRKFFAYNNGNLIAEKVAHAQCENGNVWSEIANKCLPDLLCGGESERFVQVSCPPGQEGSVLRKQKKEHPSCVFPEPVTEFNSTYVSDTCKADTGGESGELIYGRVNCEECGTEGLPARCTQDVTHTKTGNIEVRESLINCPIDGGSNGGGTQVLGITMTASPDKIMKGRPSTISWSSNATKCSPDSSPEYGSFSTGDKPNGQSTVTPSKTTAYKINCEGGGKSESKEVIIKVNTLNIIET